MSDAADEMANWDTTIFYAERLDRPKYSVSSRIELTIEKGGIPNTGYFDLLTLSIPREQVTDNIYETTHTRRQRNEN